MYVLTRSGLSRLNSLAGESELACLFSIAVKSLLSKGVVMSGSTLRRRPDEEKASILRDALERFAPLNDALDERERMMDLVRSVHSQPVRVFPMHDASEAHRLMESRELIGKIALDCRAEERAT